MAGRKPVRRSSGSRVSGSVHVSPSVHLFGGFTLFRFGGGGKGPRRRGGGLVGLLGRLSRLARQGAADLRPGKPSGGKPGRAPGKGRNDFDAFRQSRPDLFDAPEDVDVDDQGDEDAGPVGAPDQEEQAGAPTTRAHCPDCGHLSGHGSDCPRGWWL